MKVWYFKLLPKWYLGFTAGLFLLLALLPGILQYTAIDSTKPRAIYHGDAAEPKVAFACNVFWGEEFLPAMLDTLDRHNIKITFFIGGSWAKRNPELLKAIAEWGHELGNHTYSHPHPNTLDKQLNQEQITRTEQLVKSITGSQTILYAPPYGEFNDTVLRAAAELGYTTIMWTVDTVDWKRPPPDVIVTRVTKKLQNGAIVLMHPTEPTAKALQELIDRIQNAGFTIHPVSHILDK